MQLLRKKNPIEILKIALAQARDRRARVTTSVLARVMSAPYEWNLKV